MIISFHCTHAGNTVLGEMASKSEGAERDRESNKWLFEWFCGESQRQKGENKVENKEKEEQNIQTKTKRDATWKWGKEGRRCQDRDSKEKRLCSLEKKNMKRQLFSFVPVFTVKQTDFSICDYEVVRSHLLITTVEVMLYCWWHAGARGVEWHKQNGPSGFSTSAPASSLYF